MEAKELSSVAKKIIRAAVGVGLEEAGTRICGPTAWKGFRTVMSPVVRELERRYPNLFLVEKEAEKAVKDLSTDESLEKMLADGFSSLKTGQDEIRWLLAQQNETMKTIGMSVDIGFSQQGNKLEAIQAALNELKLQVAVPSPSDAILRQAASLSAQDIYKRAATLQTDAVRWVEEGDADAADQRIEEARSFLSAGLKRDPGHPDLLVCMGFVEKTRAQAAQLRSDVDGYVKGLDEAALCFQEVLKRDPGNVGALNGMANTYYFIHDYDRAIKLGMLSLESAPGYGPAAWDLMLSLEGKLTQAGPDPSVIHQLLEIYRYLEILMPRQGAAFSASNLQYVQKQREALERKGGH